MPQTQLYAYTYSYILRTRARQFELTFLNLLHNVNMWDSLNLSPSLFEWTAPGAVVADVVAAVADVDVDVDANSWKLVM